MTNGAAAGSAAAAAAAIANAIKASGAIITVEPNDFETLLRRADDPLVVCAQGGIFSTNYQYLTAYKGLIFHTKTRTPLMLSPRIELVNARKIWIPN